MDLGGLNQILNPIVTTISDILFLLEKIDMAFGILYADIELGSKGSSKTRIKPRFLALQVDSLPTETPGKP